MANNDVQMASSDFNLEKLSTKELGAHLKASISIGENVAIFGRRGSGKTEIAKQQIKSSGNREIYLNLAVLERVDMGGYPNIMGARTKEKFVEFLLPSFYEYMVDGDQDVVALLDEVDKADPSLWAPLLEFTQFRSINGHKLSRLKSIIMTGNLISEGGSRPSLPLLDRAEKYLISADATSWLEWAGASGNIHPSITAYITDNPNDLFGSVDPEDRYADPSPRGWHRASEILRKGEEGKWSSDILNRKVSGCIGKSSGMKYSAYYEHYQELLPMIDNLYKGKDVAKDFNKLEPTKKLIGSMITCARLANQLDALKIEGMVTDPSVLPESVEFVGKFLQQISPENALVAIRSQLQISRLIQYAIDEHKDWSEFMEKIHDTITKG